MAVPTNTEIRAVLEGYGITTAVVSNEWIDACRDEEILPHIEDITRTVFTGETSVTEYYNGTGKSVLILNRSNRNAITDIRIIGAITEHNLLQTTVLMGKEGIVKVRSNYNEAVYGPLFTRGEKNVLITYTHGFADYPVQVKRAIKNLVCAKMLSMMGSRTGGGDLSVQAHGRSYGSHGKFTHIRKELVNSGYSLLKKYMTGVTGA